MTGFLSSSFLSLRGIFGDSMAALCYYFDCRQLIYILFSFILMVFLFSDIGCIGHRSTSGYSQDEQRFFIPLFTFDALHFEDATNTGFELCMLPFRNSMISLSNRGLVLRERNGEEDQRKSRLPNHFIIVHAIQYMTTEALAYIQWLRK